MGTCIGRFSQYSRRLIVSDVKTHHHKVISRGILRDQRTVARRVVEAGYVHAQTFTCRRTPELDRFATPMRLQLKAMDQKARANSVIDLKATREKRGLLLYWN